MPEIRHVGRTQMSINWQTVNQELNGPRLIRGVAYNAAIKGERKTVKCSLAEWRNPDDHVLYSEESVRFTVDELEAMNLSGRPMYIQHDYEMEPVGTIMSNWVNKDGHLEIIGEVPNNGDAYSKAVISLIDNGACSDLSVGYEILRDPMTGVVTHGDIYEVSFVSRGHFRGCKVRVTASEGQIHKVPTAYTQFIKTTAEPGREEFSFMSEPTANSAANTAATPPSSQSMDESFKGTQQEFMRALSAQKKAEAKSRAEAEEAKKRADELEARLKVFEDAEVAAREQYKDKMAPQAKEITDYLKSIAEEAGVAGISEEWAKVNMEQLTANTPLAQDVQAIQVACAKGHRALKNRMIALEEENATLKQAMQMGTAMASVVDEEDAEAERYERRAVKAAARPNNPDTTLNAPGSMMMTPAADKKPAHAWLAQILGPRAAISPVAPVSAPRYVPAPAVAPAAAVAPEPARKMVKAAARPMPAAQQQQQQQFQSDLQEARPWKPGFPVNAHSTRNQERQIWGFMDKKTRDVPLGHGAYATFAGRQAPTFSEGSQPVMPVRFTTGK